MGILDSLANGLAKDPAMASALEKFNAFVASLYHVERHICQDPKCPGWPQNREGGK